MGFEFAAGTGEGIGAEGDALPLDVDEDGEEGGLDFLKDTGQSVGLDLWLEVVPELEGDVGVFDGVVGQCCGIDSGVVDHVAFLLPGDEFVKTNGCIVEEVFCEAVEVVPLAGIDQGVGDQGIEAGAFYGAVILG